MDDAHARRNNPEAVERLLCPPQQRIAFMVALVLSFHVDRERTIARKSIDLDRVVDDQVDRHERIDAPGITALSLHRRTHCRKVDDGRYALEVLEDHP